MADVEVDYQMIQSVATQLNNAVTTIVPQLTTLKTTVDGMLTQDGGLWMNSTSPALQAQYESFNTNLTNAVDSINQFATQFTQISNQVQQMDTQFATSINGNG